MEVSTEDSSLICEKSRGDRVYIDADTGEYFCEECGIQQQENRELERDIDDVTSTEQTGQMVEEAMLGVRASQLKSY
ncbi:hypothetical protein [Cryptosporidium hominis TU502]|uniref:hypothetical protein n=1 Tax=Cryptosporidium hominis (strain TU502) TaxID=353151 RepID=UPI00004532A6|nr:hypothetical protein [Cryptosporidium hominis TU502]